MKRIKKLLSLLLVLLMLFSICSCGEKENDVDSLDYEFKEVFEFGSTPIVFGVVSQEGEESYYSIYTDKENVGDALLEASLIEGDETDFGLYVKTVCNETLDYEKDGKYWAFYINDEYAVTSVDNTIIEENGVYVFKAE